MTSSSMLSIFFEGIGHIVGLYSLMPKGCGEDGTAPKCRNAMYRTILEVAVQAFLILLAKILFLGFEKRDASYVDASLFFVRLIKFLSGTCTTIVAQLINYKRE